MVGQCHVFSKWLQAFVLILALILALALVLVLALPRSVTWLSDIPEFRSQPFFSPAYLYIFFLHIFFICLFVMQSV